MARRAMVEEMGPGEANGGGEWRNRDEPPAGDPASGRGLPPSLPLWPLGERGRRSGFPCGLEWAGSRGLANITGCAGVGSLGLGFVLCVSS